MLKRLAILTMLLFVLAVQTYAKPHKAQGEGNGQKPAAPTLATAQQPSNPEIQSEPTKPIQADVRVIDGPKKDPFDVTTLVVNVVLGLVGIAGVGVGIFTLRWIRKQAVLMKEHAVHLKGLADYAESNARTTTDTLLEIRRQADLMARQTEKMERSVAASEKSAEAALSQIQMVKAKERARVSVSLDSHELNVSPAYSFDSIPIKISNDGTTSAFEVRAKGQVFGQPGENFPSMGNFDPLTVPSVIRASEEPILVAVILVQDIDLSGLGSSPIPYYFHIGGSVEYEDAFGDTHITTFRFRFLASMAQQIPASSSWRVKSIQGWKQFGSTQENHSD